MKRFFFVLLVLGLMVYETKTDNFVSSIFWYCPTLNEEHQLFFGNQSPNDMEKTYGKDLTTTVKKAWSSLSDANTVLDYITGGGITSGGRFRGTLFGWGQWFNQALIGPYFSAWGGSRLYVTQPKGPHDGASAAQLRIFALGIKDAKAGIIPDDSGNSYGMLNDLAYNVLVYVPPNLVQINGMSATEYTNTYYFSLSANAGFVLAWINGNGGGAAQNYINQYYSVGWKSLSNYDVMKNFVTIVPQSFQSSLFQEQIHLSNGNFNPPLSNVSGLEATTYFKNNKNYTIYFRLNLVTPGIPFTVNKHTNLYFVMGCQNTYTHMYSADDGSDCGDDYEF